MLSQSHNHIPIKIKPLHLQYSAVLSPHAFSSVPGVFLGLLLAVPTMATALVSHPAQPPGAVSVLQPHPPLHGTPTPVPGPFGAEMAPLDHALQQVLSFILQAPALQPEGSCCLLRAAMGQGWGYLACRKGGSLSLELSTIP